MVAGKVLYVVRVPSCSGSPYWLVSYRVLGVTCALY